MSKAVVVILLIVVMLGTVKSTYATSPFCHAPVCGKTCTSQAGCVDQQQPCYRIESREICIPAVTFPWQKCCGPPACGKVICVNVLEHDKRTRQKCEYSWPIRSTCVACGPVAEPVVSLSAVALPQFPRPLVARPVR